MRNRERMLSVSDLPVFADPMYWNGYIEKVGTGTEDIINKCREYGLKTPEFYQEEDFRVVIWRADNEGSVPMMIQRRSNDDPKAFQSVPTEEEKLLEAIKETPSISRAELSKRLKISERQVRKITDQLREKGVLIREGGNSGKWIINRT